MPDGFPEDNEYDEEREVERVLERIGKKPKPRPANAEAEVIKYKLLDVARDVASIKRAVTALWNDYQQRQGRDEEKDKETARIRWLYGIWLTALTLMVSAAIALATILHH